MDNEGFTKKAKSLSRNPLGIIALFISLVYGFACLVLSTSLNNLCGPNERLPLVWFIIGFPILILGIFTYLVVKHHTKLYAPSDFQDEEHFMSTFVRPKISSALEETRDKIKSLLEKETNAVVKQELTSISTELESIKVNSESIPINNTWRLNHWGSKSASIQEDKIVFSNSHAPKGTDGCHIDLVDSLEIGMRYEISCHAKSSPNTLGKFQLWCHDKTTEPNGVSVVTPYKVPSESGETVKLIFNAQFNKNIRIHLQYEPGRGRIEVSDVRISEIKK